MHAQNCSLLALECLHRAHSDWISSWKLYFSSAAAAWLRSRRSLHAALAGCRGQPRHPHLQEAWDQEARWRALWAALGACSVYCYKTRQGSSNRTCRIFGDLCNHVMSKGQYSFEVQCSLPCLITLTAASAYHSIKQISLCWTKFHQTSWHQITFGVIGPKLHYHSPCAFSNAGCTNCRGGQCNQVLQFLARFR